MTASAETLAPHPDCAEVARLVAAEIAPHEAALRRRALDGAARRLLARARALREDRPGCSDPLADALWERCTRGEDHGFIYGDPRAIAAVALEVLAAELAGQVRTTPDNLREAGRGC